MIKFQISTAIMMLASLEHPGNNNMEIQKKRKIARRDIKPPILNRTKQNCKQIFFIIYTQNVQLI